MSCRKEGGGREKGPIHYRQMIAARPPAQRICHTRSLFLALFRIPVFLLTPATVCYRVAAAPRSAQYARDHRAPFALRQHAIYVGTYVHLYLFYRARVTGVILLGAKLKASSHFYEEILFQDRRRQSTVVLLDPFRARYNSPPATRTAITRFFRKLFFFPVSGNFRWGQPILKFQKELETYLNSMINICFDNVIVSFKIQLKIPY